MSSFMRGLEALRASREKTMPRRRELSPGSLGVDERFGRRFRVGDVVRDSVTGGVGRVERVTTRRILVPPAKR